MGLFLIISFVAWFGGAIASICFQWKMVDEVNDHLPAEQHFEHFGWWLGKAARLWREHRRSLPDSPTRRRHALFFLLSMCGFVAAATSDSLSWPLP